jgi:hypothetical protein
MTTDIRSRLIERMRSELDARTANLPDSIPISVPIGPLADVIIDEMSDGRGVPVIPDYDHEVWSIRRWTQPFTSEEALEGGVRDVAVFLEEDRVVIRTRSGIGSVTDVTLPADDAEQFLIAGLATVKAARDARIDAPVQRG